uniref:KamA family radical SAM protein n=1 Tax=uncultured Draconibacterium sp. TaxID=1573823 RepID=UPI0032177494
MDSIAFWDKVAISVRSRKILQTLLSENPVLENIIHNSNNVNEVQNAIKNWILPLLKRNPAALKFYYEKENQTNPAGELNWQDLAAIRILDYIDHAGQEFPDQNIGGVLAKTNPFKFLWLAAQNGTSGAKSAFFNDMLQLFRQLNGKLPLTPPDKSKVKKWMKKYPSGLNPKVEELRKINQNRIIKILIEKIDSGEISSKKYSFAPGLSFEEKQKRMYKWWQESSFHLQFAIRSPELLNEMLDYSLNEETMKTLRKARKKGIPFFVNPYYLSLLSVYTPDFVVGADLAIRHYIIYSKQLVEEFGNIIAWEKEDKVKPGKPNAAGWILPSHNIHRRYPEVAIFIPDTVGRACGGLCASCQRMYDFQSGRYNFNLDRLKPEESWNERLPKLLEYFKNDAQLRDILITGGDALMSTDKSIERILDEIYKMAKAKKEENKLRPKNDKFAEIVRIRIGTRLPVYLPQRITPELSAILSRFKNKALQIGIKQFVIQTHFQSPMEITSESKRAIKLLLESGWAVTNQLVFTAAASRRGHRSKLRKVLNNLGVLSYYTFTVKGYKENAHSFAPNARSVQEQMEEKIFGTIPGTDMEFAQNLLHDPQNLVKNVKMLRKKTKLPFLSTDRSVLNLPGVGKSMTFRTIGITRYGRRILEFDHDLTRKHSPIIKKMGKVIIIEPKSIDDYLDQLLEMGEDPKEYTDVYGYSIGQTEARMAMYEYPEYEYEVTEEFTNLEI